jgi:hypothetical protein
MGAGLATVAELFDSRLRRAVDFEKLAGVPVLAATGPEEKKPPLVTATASSFCCWDRNQAAISVLQPSMRR